MTKEEVLTARRQRARQYVETVVIPKFGETRLKVTGDGRFVTSSVWQVPCIFNRVAEHCEVVFDVHVSPPLTEDELDVGRITGTYFVRSVEEPQPLVP